MDALTETLEVRTQAEPMFGRERDMTVNSAGGWVFPVNDRTRLDRFLMLGTEGGTYYTRQKQLTADNAEAVRRCVNNDGTATVARIVEVSSSGSAPKNDQALFALAMCASYGKTETRDKALRRLPDVARTGAHILMFTRFTHAMGGLRKAAKKAIGDWYRQEGAAYQVVKYRQRNGWAHRDVLRLTHPKPDDDAQDALFGWAVDPGVDSPNLPPVVHDWKTLQACKSDKEAAALVASRPALTHEMVPSEVKGPLTWAALCDRGMPIGALVRNLPTLTRHGLLKPLADRTARTAAAIRSGKRLRKGRVHPMSMLIASIVYRQGKSVRGSGEWETTAEISEALEAGFHAAFPPAPDIPGRLYVAVDVSSSMGWGRLMGMPAFTPAQAAAGMAVCLTRRAERSVCYGFADEMRDLSFNRGMSLSEAEKLVREMNFGATDCAVPMIHAAEQKIPVDCFVVLTDNETWCGKVHPAEALAAYRKQMGIPSRLVVAAFASNGFTIADPNDAGMLDVVGFDSSVPALVERFAGGSSA